VRILYLDCSTGISGDMALGALIDAGVDAETIREGIDSLGIPEVTFSTETVIKGGFRATYVRVEHPEQHAHRHLSDITALIDNASAISPEQKDLATRIFRAVATAEATVHGSTIEKVHFHEVGAIDSIVDIVGAAIAFDLLGAERIISSPVPTGRGQVKIAHGICTLPAPGTAELLKGVPLVDVPVEAELTTPTGAAILTTLVDGFAALPEMTVETIGYGAGTRDLPGRANVLRVLVGTAAVSAKTDQVMLLETNLDDVAPEIVAYAKKQLLDAGALDVFTTPIQMKKNRSGVMLSVLCRPPEAERFETILFNETNTFGIRRSLVQRSKRLRREETVTTPFGPVKGKLGWRTGERPCFVPEFDDCARIAGEVGVPLREVYRAAEANFVESRIVPPESSPPTFAADSPVHDHDHDHDHPV